MKTRIAIACFALLPAVSLAQSTQESTAGAVQRFDVEMSAQGAVAGARFALETRVTRDKPYSAEAATEFIQVLGDGNRIVRRSTARMLRDSEGRTRREELNDAGERTSIVITDPVTVTSFVLDPDSKTAFKSPALFARVAGAPGPAFAAGRAAEMRQKFEVVAQPPDAMARSEASAQWTVAEKSGAVSTFTIADGGPLMTPGGRGETSKEDLGQQTIEGVAATGTRTTTVIPAGAIGNEQPITIVSEQWFSADLGVLILTRHSDPRVGETTYRVTNISRDEPDRTLFQVPADYTLRDRTPKRF